MTSTNFIELKNVQTFLTKVSEEIDSKYIKNYVYTQIQSQGLTLDTNSKIIYTYIKKINSYQISIINSSNKDFILEPYILEVNYLEKKNKLLDLYICNKFFALYKDSKLIYFKEIKDESVKKDIVTYINQTLDINIDNIYEISNDKLEEYKRFYILNSSKFVQIKYITKQDSKSAIIYLSYVFIVILILGIYSFDNFYQNKILIRTDIKDMKIEHVKNEYDMLLDKYEDNKKVTSNLITLFNLLDKHDIKLLSIKIAQNRSSVMVKATKKEVLLDFLDFYDEDSIINNMKYIKEDNCYEMQATIKLY